MMRRFLPFLLTIFLLAAATTAADFDYFHVNKNLGRIIFTYTYTDSVGNIEQKSSLGSCVLINVNGVNKIVTCYHIISNKPSGKILVYFNGNDRAYSPAVEIEVYSKQYDLLILSVVGDIPWDGVKIASDMEWGEKIYFGGYSSLPLPKIRIGFMVFHVAEGIYIDPVYFGDSGGGVFNEDGELLGIIHKTFELNHIPTLVGYAIPYGAILQTLK